MKFETQRLILRDWKIEDAEDLFKVASDADVALPCGWKPHENIEECKHIIKDMFLTDPYTYAVCLKENNIAIGCIAIIPQNINRLNLKNENEVELGCWIGKEFWGRGLMVEAMNVLIDFAFNKLNVENIYCGYSDGNSKSKRLQEKCGFVHLYTEEAHLYKTLNEIRIHHVNILTKDSWRKNGNYKK